MARLLSWIAIAWAVALPLKGAAAGCHDPAFVDQIAESAWVNLDVMPAQGTAGIRNALRAAQSQHATQPVRIRLAPGHYADNLGSEVYAQALWRTAATPIWLRATDPRPNATVLGHGINLLAVAYVAIDGVTIGPARVGPWDGTRHAAPGPLQAAAGIHVAGVALDGTRSAASGSTLNLQIYGRFQASHHVLVRRVTVQNLFGADERDAETAEGHSMDGMKFNQVQDLWVLDSRVHQTSRHGIDNVGVHRAAFCRNLVARTGGGMGIEAKGGSVDVLYDSNTFYRVRRVELGGEETDAVYYFSLDGRWDYEALRTVARNNLIVDARESALDFSGCSDCSAVGNTVFFSASYTPPGPATEPRGGDAVRAHDSRLLGAADGAGNDCQSWDAARADFVTVNPCWGVGSRAPAPVNKVLLNQRLVVANNVFFSERPLWGRGGGAVVPCPLNVNGPMPQISWNGNHWWNGGAALPQLGCSALAEGSGSRLPQAGQGTAPLRGGTFDSSSLERMSSSLLDITRPVLDGALRHAVTAQAMAAYDHQGAPRGTTAGALGLVVGAWGGAGQSADRIFNWAERLYPSLFPTAALSQTLGAYYARHYPQTQTYVGAWNGKIYGLGPAFGPDIVELGSVANFLEAAIQAGH